MSAGRERPGSAPLRIVLTGFMGAGKSTVGRLLAERLAWRFLDIDTHLAAEHQRSIAEIFAQHGEPYFRSLEAAAVHHAMSLTSTVIALGGGALETESVRDRLFPARTQQESLVIFLDAPLHHLLARCQPAAAHPPAPVRPLLDAAEAPADRLARRLPHYRRAHLTIDTGTLTPDAVVQQILQSPAAGGLLSSAASAGASQ